MEAKIATEKEKYAAAQKFVGWLVDRVKNDATGAAVTEADHRPDGRYWLGRLAPETEIRNHRLGERAERLEPCAIGFRLAPSASSDKVNLRGFASFVVWRRTQSRWFKSELLEAPFDTEVDVTKVGTFRLDGPFADSVSSAGVHECISAAIEFDVRRLKGDRCEIAVTLVNTSNPDHPMAPNYANSRLFESRLYVENTGFDQFELETLPDSFRYDRSVPAWGINCGVSVNEEGFETSDFPAAEKRRPEFWNVNAPLPDLRFETLSSDPLPSLKALTQAHADWGREAWNVDAIAASSTGMDEGAFAALEEEVEGFREEAARLASGVDRLEQDEDLNAAFRFMNRAMIRSAGGKYDRWRPFQIGFLLANIGSCAGEEKEFVDIVWFATGGGKTETYLGLILTAAFHDRISGKVSGVTAWSRFPLRLLSLQQTQRFANALAAAEIVRREEKIVGTPFGLGFLVGDGSTPNRISNDRSPSKRGRWDVDDLAMPDKLRMLKVCPFCREDSIEMNFDRATWRLEHRCNNSSCEWGVEEPLPIWVVDADIWRFLPTVIVGTLDKAAGVALQAAMKGMIGPPAGMCSEAGHGYTYAPRSGRANGCLVPDCDAPIGPLPMKEHRFGMTYRLQDELHLLRDSLGAVDGHYEALLDDLQAELSQDMPKILASSATLSGYERQSKVLYRRRARVFPHPEPKIGQGFWAGDTDNLMRLLVAVAPRGQTIEYALDRMIVSLQSAIRDLLDRPTDVAEQLGIDHELIDFLILNYGTNVVYGNTLRDLEAVVRSATTQWGEIPDPKPKVAALTGRTIFEDVAETLERLEKPEEVFSDRLHVIAASSMMSHGVDVDRLNIMAMLGLPLTTAEFIQATARVGRRWPAIAFVVHKIGRERDASIYRSFDKYVLHGDRFVEPIPITGKSRRVLERTIPGLAFGRLLMLHEERAARTIWKAYGLREYFDNSERIEDAEIDAICELLGYTSPDTVALRAAVTSWYRVWARRVRDPANSSEWSNSLGIPAVGPMRSLRDVEEQVDVWGPDPQ